MGTEKGRRPRRVRLHEPAHLYLLWLGSSGKVGPLYPWNEGLKLVQQDAGTAPPVRKARAELRSLPVRGKGWVMGGRSGLEAIVLLGRRTPLPARVSLARLVGELPGAPLLHLREWAVLRHREGTVPAHALVRGGNRDPDCVIDPPVAQRSRPCHDGPRGAAAGRGRAGDEP